MFSWRKFIISLNSCVHKKYYRKLSNWYLSLKWNYWRILLTNFVCEIFFPFIFVEKTCVNAFLSYFIIQKWQQKAYTPLIITRIDLWLGCTQVELKRRQNYRNKFIEINWILFKIDRSPIKEHDLMYSFIIIIIERHANNECYKNISKNRIHNW